jgi:hypothetical protein
MAKFRNDHPLGDLEVPALGKVVKAGETFTVPDEEAGMWTAFTPVDRAAKAGVARALVDPDERAEGPGDQPDEQDGQADGAAEDNTEEEVAA